MNALRPAQPVSTEAYLQGELESPVKHEYVGGEVYAMSGGRNRHNHVAGNIFGYLFSRLRGKPCRPYNSDTKIRIRLAHHTRFYYPDASVICQPNPPDDLFQDLPTVVVEVLSDSTRRIDLAEKKEAYLTIPTLAVYLLVEPDSQLVVVYRRGPQGFEREVWQDEQIIPLPEIGTELPLAEIYEGL